jgi:hypothetical protein
MTTNDPRRLGIIETRFRPGPPQVYQLTIAGQLWAAVEWSSTRRAWCVEDAAGRRLAHCEHIHGQNIDRPTALALAKQMIRDGRMPTPEEAEGQLQEVLWSQLFSPISDQIDDVFCMLQKTASEPAAPTYRRVIAAPDSGHGHLHHDKPRERRRRP